MGHSRKVLLGNQSWVRIPPFPPKKQLYINMENPEVPKHGMSQLDTFSTEVKENLELQMAIILDALDITISTSEPTPKISENSITAVQNLYEQYKSKFDEIIVAITESNLSKKEKNELYNSAYKIFESAESQKSLLDFRLSIYRGFPNN